MNAMTQKRIYALTPAKEWMEGLPMGNGRLAAMVWGDKETDRLTLNHEWLWTGRNRDRRCAEAAEHLGEVRDCIRREDWNKAAELGNHYFGGAGGISGRPTRVDPYQPAGDLTFRLDSAPAFSSRELDLETGLARTLRGPVETRIFTSCTDGTILCRWQGETPFSGEFTLSREAQEATTLTFSTAPETIRMDGAISGGIDFAVEVRLTTDGRAAVAGEGRVRVENASWITAEINMATSHEDLEKELASYRFAGDFEKSLAAHGKRFREWMDRLSLNLTTDPALEALPTEERVRLVREGGVDNGLCLLYFDFGRYLLLSSSICGELPANLQGKWNDLMAPPWQCDYHFDINLEMNYWMAEPAGLPECSEALTRYVLSFLDSGREAAERLYGCGGIYLPLQSDAWGRSTPESYGWGVWIGAAPWIARQLWDHWRYTGDRAYLERVYPFFSGVAEFYGDYLVRDGNGTYQILPSQSPENFITGLEFPVLLGQSSAMDVQLCYDALTYAIEAAEILGKDAPYRDLWRTIRDHLPSFSIGPDGRLLEWDRELPEGEPGHRHLSHLYGLYPSDLFTPETRPEQYQAAVRSLGFRLSHGGGHTGWSRAWVACLRARTGDSQGFYEHFTALIKEFATATLLDLHPPRIFQIDGNLGAVAAALEAVAGFYDGKAHLLPALPREWAEGSVEGLRLPGGHRLSMAWKDGRLTSAEVVLGFSGHLTAVYAETEQTVTGAPGEKVQLHF